jgi:hypothetical protein
MKNNFFVYIIIGLSPLSFLSGISNQRIRISEVGYGWAKTSVNTAIFRQNSIVSHDNEQYIAFYDSTGHVTLGKRKYGSDYWMLNKSHYTGNVLDAHNVISIMIDGEGYLHMAWDHHGNKLNYCRSLSPGSLEMSHKMPMTTRFEEKVTYPQFFRMSDGNLLFAYRDGSSGNGNLVLNRYDTKLKKWQQLHSNLIDGENQRNAYWQIFLDKNDILHLSWVWRESGDVATNHDMCYARSSDGGETWNTSSNDEYTLPINVKNAEYAMKIQQGSDLINQTSMTADHNSHPIIATYFQKKGDIAPQVYVIFNIGKGWEHMKVDHRNLDFELGGTGTRSIPISRPIILHSYQDGFSKLHVIYRDEEYNNNACLKTIRLNNDPFWTTILLSDNGLDRWEPTFDTELWKQKGRLNLFIQKVGQGSGEKAIEMPPQMIIVMEIDIMN